MPLVELYEGFFVNPETVAVVKATDKNQSAIFTSGQSAVDGGFTVPYSAEEVSQQINDAESELYQDEEEGEEQEQE